MLAGKGMQMDSEQNGQQDGSQHQERQHQERQRQGSHHPAQDQASLPLDAAPAAWAAEDRALFHRVAAHLNHQASQGRLPDPWREPDARVHPHLVPLTQLLLDARADHDGAHATLARCLACACMGSHHLWQDLGLSGRPEVSRLMLRAFPAIHAANTRNLRWKRHLFILLGERLGVDHLLPPRCSACEDAPACLGTSAVPVAQAIRVSPPSRG